VSGLIRDIHVAHLPAGFPFAFAVLQTQSALRGWCLQ
jgi:hypothetical protein